MMGFTTQFLLDAGFPIKQSINGPYFQLEADKYGIGGDLGVVCAQVPDDDSGASLLDVKLVMRTIE
jgi:hypothetical protein